IAGQSPAVASLTRSSPTAASAAVAELGDHLLHEPAPQLAHGGGGLGGEQEAGPAQLVGPLQQVQVALGGAGGGGGGRGLKVDGPLAACLGRGHHIPVAVALTPEPPVELVDQ